MSTNEEIETLRTSLRASEERARKAEAALALLRQAINDTATFKTAVSKTAGLTDLYRNEKKEIK